MPSNSPWRFLILYGALYAGFGAQSPYLPTLLESRNLGPEAIALVLGAGTAIRLIAGPVAGRLADILKAPKTVLAACSVAAALIALGYVRGTGLLVLLVVGVLQSAALAPLAPLTDTLALASAAPDRSARSAGQRFHYGWVRGAGSAAFICGTLLSGAAIQQFGIAAAIWLNAGLLTAAAFAARVVPVLPLPTKDAGHCLVAGGAPRGFGALLRLPLYRRIIFVAALILGSHAMHDSFAVVRWEAAGVGPSMVGVLWSISVAAEVVVFSFIGRPLLDRIGPARAAMLAAAAGILRWVTMAETTWLPALAAVAATTRVDIRAITPDLHAASRAMRPWSPGSNRVDGLRYGWHWPTIGTADNRLRPALVATSAQTGFCYGGALRRGATSRSQSARAQLIETCGAHRVARVSLNPEESRERTDEGMEVILRARHSSRLTRGSVQHPRVRSWTAFRIFRTRVPFVRPAPNFGGVAYSSLPAHYAGFGGVAALTCPSERRPARVRT